MIKEVEEKFEELEAQLEQLLAETAALTPEQFHYRPAPDSWSIAQVFQHLVKAETATNTYMKKKIQAGSNLKQSGLNARLSSGLLRLMMRSPFKFKAPKLVAVDPGPAQPYEEQVAEWKHQRSEMKEFLDGLDEATAQKLIFKHGSGVRMNASQMVMWTGAHIGRHLKQIERLRNNAGFPAIE